MSWWKREREGIFADQLRAFAAMPSDVKSIALPDLKPLKALAVVTKSKSKRKRRKRPRPVLVPSRSLAR